MNKIFIAFLIGALLLAGCTELSDLTGQREKITGVEVGKSTMGSFTEESPFGGHQVVIKTGNVRVLVQQGTLENKFAQLKVIIAENGGELTGISYNEYTMEKGYYLTVKIELKNFDSILGEIKKLGEVKSVNTNLEDVTTQYRDLEIRIRNLKSELDTLNSLYNRTDNIDDILKIRSEINNVVTQLEIYEQQRRNLERKAVKSTITVYMYEEKPAIERDLFIPLGDLAAVFFGAMSFAITLVVGAVGFLIPGTIVLLVILMLWKMHRKK